ncbi:short-chain dehydrogenase [Pseudalkalibacillus sp. Hm43]|uniref:short-chain dehydrogenase n=1 Tax=Pseudalkalibacillus sp. Hm43 TaxID=3450742 RepID=UPI003F42EA2D
MRKGLAYVCALFSVSFLLFFIVTSTLETAFPSISFFLATIVGTFILDKNQWFVEWFEIKGPTKNEGDHHEL